jgi:hypothetical protein
LVGFSEEGRAGDAGGGRQERGPRLGSHDAVGVEAGGHLELVDRSSGRWAEDPVVGYLERPLQPADAIAAVAESQYPPRAVARSQGGPGLASDDAVDRQPGMLLEGHDGLPGERAEVFVVGDVQRPLQFPDADATVSRPQDERRAVGGPSND